MDSEDSVPVFKSTDWVIIQKQKIGSRVKVHISNLHNPPVSKQLRPLDYDHIANLKVAFSESFRQDYMTMVGLVDKRPDNLEDFVIPGKISVKVIGGNHSRLAIQESKVTEFVFVEVFAQLTDAQALLIGLEHNTIHENAKKMTFQDYVLLFRNIFASTKLKHEGLPAKRISELWRSEVAGITGKSKDDLKSLFKVHLHLAALDDEAWGSVLDVLNAYRQVKIKGQKAGDIPTQYVFGRLFKVKETSTKSKLLSALASGELTVAQFRKKCARNGQENQNSQTSAINSLLEDEAEDESYVEGTDDCSKKQHGTHLTRKGMKENYGDDYSFMITSLEKEKELRKMAQSVLQQKCILVREKEERIQQLIEEKEKLQRKHEKDLASVQHEMERYKRDNKAMMGEVQELKKQLANERMKCRAAEETAARARAMLQCSSTKTPLKRKTTSDGKETIPVKKAKTDQDIIPDPKEDAILIPPSPLKKQKKLTKKAIVSLDPLPVKKVQTDRDIIPGAKEDMILSSQCSVNRQRNLTKNASDSKIALVEYNQGRVYYVLRDPEDTNKGIYFKAPIGYIKYGLFCHKPTKLSFVLNKKDVQSVDRKFIICEFTGVIEDGIIRVNKMSISPQEQVHLISNYVKQC